MQVLYCATHNLTMTIDVNRRTITSGQRNIGGQVCALAMSMDPHPGLLCVADGMGKPTTKCCTVTDITQTA